METPVEDPSLRFRQLAEWLVAMDAKDHDQLPVAVKDMTPREFAIFQLVAKYLGQLQFLTREAQFMLSRTESEYRDFRKLTERIFAPRNSDNADTL